MRTPLAVVNNTLPVYCPPDPAEFITSKGASPPLSTVPFPTGYTFSTNTIRFCSQSLLDTTRPEVLVKFNSIEQGLILPYHLFDGVTSLNMQSLGYRSHITP